MRARTARRPSAREPFDRVPLVRAIVGPGGESRMNEVSQATSAPPALARALRAGPDLYLVHTQPGFEAVASEEVAARAAGAREVARRVVPGRAGMTLVEVRSLAALTRLRVAEDVFSVIACRRGLAGGQRALDQVRAAARETPYLEAALAARVRLSPQSRAGRRLRFRVVTRLCGRHDFRRVDLGRTVERGIEERTDRRFRLVAEDADVEFWATMLDDEFVLALRLSDERMRHRDYKVAHRPGALRPSVAAALGWLSGPGPDDVVLDPLCGTGTILIERAHLGRYRMLYGFDRDPDALAAARENVGRRYKPIELARWDATALPLGAGSVSHVITNLPWGIKHGTPEQNRELYPRLVAEFRRVTRAGGVIVMLTGQGRLLARALEREGLRPVQVLRVSILGAPAAVYVCRAA